MASALVTDLQQLVKTMTSPLKNSQIEELHSLWQRETQLEALWDDDDETSLSSVST